jgi:DNA-binding beta-propeller fold protein YncE
VVTPVDVSTRTPGKPIPVEIYADTVAIAPDGRRVYVGTIAAVDIVDVATNAVIGSVNGGWVDFPNAGLAITPDGATLFVSDDESTGGSFAQAITLRTNEPGKIFSHAGPGAIAVTPAQAPTARFTWTAGPVGAATHFDASRSIPGTGHIARYAWHFGDGTGAVTTTPRTSHVYSVAGTYTTVLQVTNSQQTSVRQVFTGQTMSRNGAPRARRAEPVTIR